MRACRSSIAVRPPWNVLLPDTTIGAYSRTCFFDTFSTPSCSKRGQDELFKPFRCLSMMYENALRDGLTV